MKCLVALACLFGVAYSTSDINFYRQCMPEEFGTLWPNYNNRSTFYACANIGVNEKKSCYPGLYFRFDMQVCVWKWEWKAPPSIDDIKPVDADDEYDVPPEDEENVCEDCWRPECDNEEDQSILWPNYEDHTSYFMCARLFSYVKKTCYPKLKFNFMTQVCEWPNNWTAPPSLEEMEEAITKLIF